MSDRDVEKEIDKEIRKELKEPRIKDKDLFETVEEVFDRATVLTLIRLKQRGVISKISGVVSAGKEARVYVGRDYEGNYLAIKIYLTATMEFKKGIWKYIKGDPRYEWILSLPSHKLMAVWARKEFSNLKRMYEAGVSVPKPVVVERNVLVMEFIGENGVRAPLLKELADARLIDRESAMKFFKEVIENVYRMYWYAGLVHGDLSEYNIMVHNDKLYIIDVGQAVKLEHPNAHMFLYRDLNNITRFFSEELELRVPSTEQLFNAIVNKNYEALKKLTALEEGMEYEE